jgi:chromosome segregation ATPase
MPVEHEHASIQRALEPLKSEFDRITQTCRDLTQQLEREITARRAAVRERDQLLAEVARLRSQIGLDEQTRAEVGQLRDARRTLERRGQEHAARTEELSRRSATLQAELEAVRGELGVAEEERTCLEEQIRHLTRTIALINTENRLLRRESRPASGTKL